MSGILEKLFGSASRIKIIRLFFLNPESVFPSRDVTVRAKVNRAETLKELGILADIGLIRRASISVAAENDAKKKHKIQGWTLLPSFPFLRELKNLLLSSAPISKDFLMKKLKGLGRVKLVVLSGTFLQQDDSRIDLLVVGDNIKQGSLERILRNLEAEIGKELSYALLTTDEFKYRIGMYDKFIRDILDYPHEKLLDKIGIE